MRCPRCFCAVPVDADRCPRCKLATPKIQPSGVSSGIAGKYAAPQVKTKKTALGKPQQPARAQAGSGIKLPRWQLIVLFSSTLVVFALIGYGLSEYRFWHTSAPTDDLGALHLVERAHAKQGGTIGEALTTYVQQLVDENKVDDVDGWRVECQGSKCRVTYTVKLVGESPRTAVWEVDIERKQVSPQNNWAQELTK